MFIELACLLNGDLLRILLITPEKQVKDAPIAAVTVPALGDGVKIFIQRFHGSITLPSD